jgi:hypothetical protein
MPTYPPIFQFSQSSLQDFNECQRRFQLRYLLQQQWPAPIAEPIGEFERADQLGKLFHLNVERYWLEVPLDHIPPSLLVWMGAFFNHPPQDLPGEVRRPEVRTSALVHGRRVTATFDLLAYEDEASDEEPSQAPRRAVIVDWKTNHKKPSRTYLDRRLQTILYPLLLVLTAEQLIGHALRPEDVTLVYWFANAPEEPEVFTYSQERFEHDMQHLGGLFAQIETIDAEVWPLTPDIRKCRYCEFRSLCDRGREAGAMDEIDDVEDADAQIRTAEEDLDEYVL